MRRARVANSGFAMATPTEIVHRPEAGLARGFVEAKPWMLGVLVLLTLMAAAAYGAYRAGLFTKLRRRK